MQAISISKHRLKRLSCRLWTFQGNTDEDTAEQETPAEPTEDTEEAETPTTPETPETPVQAGDAVHVVQSGDTLYAVAKNMVFR